MRTVKTKSYWPQYGAIFMANKSTREECFQSKLFGLPYKFADFVMEVKTGMLLFLFDFDERNLYGVFEAASDGAINIIPDAYMSTSRAKFPAQVRFTTLWHCDPLPEYHFRDAIEENYYERNKFNFGLSRDQVSRLLALFQNRMIKIPSSPVEKSQDQESSQSGKSAVLVPPYSLDISELINKSIHELQESILQMPEMQESIQESVPDNLCHLNTCELEQSADYIPLPSEPDEIEDPYEVFKWDNMSFTEVGECLKRPLIWPLDLHSRVRADDKKLDDNCNTFRVQERDSESSIGRSSSYPKTNIACKKQIHDSNGSEFQKMYSDGIHKRTSAFLRLSGRGKLMVKEHHSQVDNLMDILEGLDMKRKFWDHKRSSENGLKSASVFTRLGSRGQVQQIDQNARYRAGEVKYIEENSAHQSYKRKSYEHFSRDEQRNRSRHRSEKYTMTNSKYYSDEGSVCTLDRQECPSSGT